jgi:hypothetical protein
MENGKNGKWKMNNEMENGNEFGKWKIENENEL